MIASKQAVLFSTNKLKFYNMNVKRNQAVFVMKFKNDPQTHTQTASTGSH